jgi:hypothetical protein
LIFGALTVSAACGRANQPAPDGSASANRAAEAGPARNSGPTPPGAIDRTEPVQNSQDEELPSEEAVRQLLERWNGDLDGMVERRYVRMLVTFSKTNYFLDKAEQRGLTYEAGKRATARELSWRYDPGSWRSRREASMTRSG